MTWDTHGSNFGTSVHYDGHLDHKLHDPRVFGSGDGLIHGIFGIEAVSLYSRDLTHRAGEMKLNIQRRGPAHPPNREAIVNFLLARFQYETDQRHFKYSPSVVGPINESWTETIFTVSFILGNDEHFCDMAIEIARAVFIALGVHDENGYYLARFAVKRETFAMIDASWITFPRWLRMKHRLPIVGPEDPL
ncbi:MAG: hypothetical protein AAB691_04175 [Patescibacteria group bacterium]